MSVAYSQQNHPGNPRNNPVAPPTTAQIQKILDENCGLIQTIQDYQNMGKVHECMTYHQALHKNLVYLAQLADSTQNINQILPVCNVFCFRLLNCLTHTILFLNLRSLLMCCNNKQISRMHLLHMNLGCHQHNQCNNNHKINLLRLKINNQLLMHHLQRKVNKIGLIDLAQIK